MSEKEQLAICETCTNRKMDMDRGLLCNLSNEKPTFIDSCNDFVKDETIKIVREYDVKLEVGDIQHRVSERSMQKFKSEQNLSLGILASFGIGLIGAFIWASITVATEFQIGYMAIAIGAAVGYSLRIVGKGIDPIFGISGAVIAVLSCLLGNFFSLIGFVANSEGLGYLDTLLLIDYSIIPTAMAENFSPIDLFFYGIAGYEGYKFSFRVFTENDLKEIEK